MQSAQLSPHLNPQLRIQVGQRLVEQQQVRLHHEGARECHALLLSARKLRRKARMEFGEINGFERSRYLVANRVIRSSPDAKRVGDVLEHRHVRKERVILKDHSDPPAMRG